MGFRFCLLFIKGDLSEFGGTEPKEVYNSGAAGTMPSPGGDLVDPNSGEKPTGRSNLLHFGRLYTETQL